MVKIWIQQRILMVNFGFEGLSAGTYTVMAQTDGYKAWESSVMVSEDGETFTIEMEPSEYYEE